VTGSAIRHQLFLARRAVACARHLRHLPAVVLGDAFPGIDELEITVGHRFRPRGLPHGDAYVLALIVAYLQPARIFEIGTGTGEATALMARQAPGARIDTLDLGARPAALGTQRGDLPLEAQSVGEAFRDGPWASSIHQHLGDSAGFDFSPFHGRTDLVFVDGAHTARYTLNDSRAALAMAGERGVVLWDDCHLHHPGVSRALVGARRRGTAVARLADTRFALWQGAGSPRTPPAAQRGEEVAV
jgi:predicted O-methyltransferase YrrM